MSRRHVFVGAIAWHRRMQLRSGMLGRLLPLTAARWPQHIEALCRHVDSNSQANSWPDRAKGTAGAQQNSEPCLAFFAHLLKGCLRHCMGCERTLLLLLHILLRQLLCALLSLCTCRKCLCSKAQQDCQLSATDLNRPQDAGLHLQSKGAIQSIPALYGLHGVGTAPANRAVPISLTPKFSGMQQQLQTERC